MINNRRSTCNDLDFLYQKLPHIGDLKISISIDSDAVPMLKKYNELLDDCDDRNIIGTCFMELQQVFNANSKDRIPIAIFNKIHRVETDGCIAHIIGVGSTIYRT